MARIRIVDAWLRCPTVAAPSYQRAIMVVAEAWAEQRVLMRAYAESADQTRPTISLHGNLLAIGPAGLDPHGPWGIHVEPPVDGRAQKLKLELELAARRLSGSKGNPPRLMDEESSFERKRTNNWAPGTPPDLPPGSSQAGPSYYEPSEAPLAQAAAASLPAHAAPTLVPGMQPQPGPGPLPPASPAMWPQAPVAPAHGQAPAAAYPAAAYPAVAPAAPGWAAPGPAEAHGSPYNGQAAAAPGSPGPVPEPWLGAGLPAVAPARPAPRGGQAQTVYGFASGADDRTSEPDRPAPPGRRMGSLVGRTMPLGLRLTDKEYEVLNALDEARTLTAGRVAEIVGTGDGHAWMADLIAKLADCGLDLIIAAREGSGELVYMLRG